jgi:mono/diheme cytochrome c family protein
MIEKNTYWFLEFLGHLHPMIVHFPVSVIIVAALLEVFTLRSYNSKLRAGIRILVIIGAGTAAFSVLFGWLLSVSGDYEGEKLDLHKWTGIATALLGFLTAAMLYVLSKKQTKFTVSIYRFLLFFTTAGVTIAGHIGAELTHGGDFLSSTLPWNIKKGKPLVKFDLVSLKKDSLQLSDENQKALYAEVQSIFSNSCYKCHGPDKKKGGLRLDIKLLAFKGGEDGPVIVPGQPDKSDLFRRITLPGDHKEAMPTEGKRLKKQDIEVIEFWISKGAPWPEDGGTLKIAKIAESKPEAITKLLVTKAEDFSTEDVQLNTEVRAILAHNCYSCHGAKKMKAGLRLDSKSMAFKGGEDGPIIIPGKPNESELFRRINLPVDHKEFMPSDAKKLSQRDIGIVKLWIAKGAPWPEAGGKGAKVPEFRIAELAPRNPKLPMASGSKKFSNPVDIWVNDYFKKRKINWPGKVDDRIYLRRIYLDIIGFLPSPEDFQRFATDNRPDKRAIWVRELLNRQDDYALHWLTFWNDALRNDYTGTGYITGGRSNITNWLYQALRKNKPYDQFVRELLNPTDESKGFIQGIEWRGVINSSQTTEMQAAQNVSQVFLGLNLKCASCHNSFISDWKLDDAYAFANVFSNTSLEINRCDKPTGRFVDPRMLWKELGTISSKATVEEKRKQLAQNMTKPVNGRLYRTIVNRVWAQMMGRGLVEPVDVMDNEPWDQDLLDWMAFNFTKKQFDTKELIYMIATSDTYQLRSVGFKDAALIGSPKYKFTGMLRKRMTAEQFTDAISNVIFPVFNENELKYNPFKTLTYSNSNKTTAFVRSSLVANNSYLTSLGRPNRETVATSRDSQANLLQALEFTNGTTFNEAVKQGAKRWQPRFKDKKQAINEFYLKALGRTPTDKELSLADKALGDSPDGDAIQDLFWSIVLLPEFQIIY